MCTDHILWQTQGRWGCRRWARPSCQGASTQCHESMVKGHIKGAIKHDIFHRSLALVSPAKLRPSDHVAGTPRGRRYPEHSYRKYSVPNLWDYDLLTSSHMIYLGDIWLPPFPKWSTGPPAKTRLGRSTRASRLSLKWPMRIPCSSCRLRVDTERDWC